jgi:selenocysteine-specific elongation factor
MVAGAASIDVLMLVVAADDGVMPQTDEHTKILKLLRTPQVVVALTKMDLVSPERLEQVRQDLAAFLERMGFPGAPIINVSNKTGDGLDEVREALNTLVDRAAQRTPDPRVFRMNVERTFLVKGLGTVVTGIPLSGSIRLGEKAELLPAALPTAIRTIQTFKFDAEVAQAHVCAAINLRDVESGQAARGMTLAAPGVFRAVTSFLATLQNASDSFCFKRATGVKLHTGTSMVLATVKLLGSNDLKPGRDGSVATAGGGKVLSARAQQIKRLSVEFLERLEQAAAAVNRGDLLGSELCAGPQAVLPASELIRLTQLPEPLARETIREKEQRGELVNLGGGAWLVRARASELLKIVQPAVAHYHKNNKLAWGLSPALVCQLVGVDAQNFPKLAEVLCADGTLAVKHGRLALASFQPAVSTGQTKQREDLLARVTAAGIHAPARGDLVAAMKVSEAEMKTLVQLLVEDGSIKVLGKNFLSGAVYADCRKKLLELFARNPVVDISAFRQAVGAPRNLAAAILESFDVEGLTKRVDNGRILVKKQS